MATIRYAVLRVDHEWRVVCERRHIGHFRTQAQAVKAGAQLAREAVSSGHAVEFMLQGPTGLLQAQCFMPRPEAPAPTLRRRAPT